MTTPSPDERHAMAKEIVEGPLDLVRGDFLALCETAPGDHISPFIGLALVERLTAAEQREAELRAEIERLKEVAEEYGTHKGSCGVYNVTYEPTPYGIPDLGYSDPKPRSCGLTAALSDSPSEGTDAWQESEARADADFTAGRSRSFDNLEDLKRDLTSEGTDE